MHFDFDTPINRRGTYSYKWDSAADAEVLPMWVADMDFHTAPGIVDALQKRVAHRLFGYTRVPDSYFDAVTGWFARRYGFHFDREALLFTTGVVPALSAVIQALCKPGDGVIVQNPAYNCFFSSIRNSECRMVSNALHYEDGEYTIDFADLERKAADPDNTLLLLCNPHNPVGRVWRPDELQRLGEIALAHGLTILVDEIHCDLAQPGFHHTPFASLSDEFMHASVTCSSPSKAFNLAGLQVANILVADPRKRQLINKQLNINEVCEISPFAVEAVMAAYNEGGAWLDALRTYLAGNYTYLVDFISKHLPQLHAPRLEATYLVWLDCSVTGLSSAEMASRLYEHHKLWLNEGPLYGVEGEGFLRINIATPRQRLIEGLNRLKAAFAHGGALAAE